MLEEDLRNSPSKAAGKSCASFELAKGISEA
jgi:hypothetical protein